MCAHILDLIDEKWPTGEVVRWISQMVKRSTRVTAETVAWGYLIQAIAGAAALLLAVYWIFFRH